MKTAGRLIRLIAHVTAVFGIMFLTFCIIDMQNSAMAFLDNPISRTLIMIWAALTLISSAATYYLDAKGKPDKTTLDVAELNKIGEASSELAGMLSDITKGQKVLAENQAAIAKNLELLTRIEAERQRDGEDASDSESDSKI